MSWNLAAMLSRVGCFLTMQAIWRFSLAYHVAMGGQAWPDSVTYVEQSFVATAGKGETAYRGMSYVE